MKKLMIMLVAVSFLCGCATFGTFDNFKQGETTKEEVQSMLGEPEKKRFEGDQEIWQYYFTMKDRKKLRKMQTILNLDIIFKEKEIDNYNITVSQESVKEMPKKGLQEGRSLPPAKGPIQPQKRAGEEFIYQFDRNNDGRVSRSEFNGPERLFNRLDRNDDGFIDVDEVPEDRPSRKKKRKH